MQRGLNKHTKAAEGLTHTVNKVPSLIAPVVIGKRFLGCNPGGTLLDSRLTDSPYVNKTSGA